MRLVERAQAYEAVLATLGSEDPVRVLAFDGERRRFEAGFFAGTRLDHLRLEAAVIGPALVHAQEHLGALLRIRSADVRLDPAHRPPPPPLAAAARPLPSPPPPPPPPPAP